MLEGRSPSSKLQAARKQTCASIRGNPRVVWPSHMSHDRKSPCKETITLRAALDYIVSRKPCLPRGETQHRYPLANLQGMQVYSWSCVDACFKLCAYRVATSEASRMVLWWQRRADVALVHMPRARGAMARPAGSPASIWTTARAKWACATIKGGVLPAI